MCTALFLVGTDVSSKLSKGAMGSHRRSSQSLRYRDVSTEKASIAFDAVPGGAPDGDDRDGDDGTGLTAAATDVMMATPFLLFLSSYCSPEPKFFLLQKSQKILSDFHLPPLSSCTFFPTRLAHLLCAFFSKTSFRYQYR